MKQKKVVPKIQLKIMKNSGDRQTITTDKRMKIYANLTHDLGTEWNLKVSYGSGICNSYCFSTAKDARYALKCWTEADLIKYIEEGEW